MHRSSFWLLCVLGCAIFSQGLSRPQDDYQEDGDGEEYDADEDVPVGPPPKIKSQGLTLDLDVGQVAVLPCDVEGNPGGYSRMWRKGREEKTGLFLGTISQNSDPRINLLKDGSLEIRQVQPGDSDTYSCMISSEKGEEILHVLNIKSPAQIVSIKPSNKTHLKKGFSLTLECIAQGYPTPSIKWFRNGHVLEDQDPSIHGARYTITNATLEDSGRYKCSATNHHQQQPDERVVEVEVQYPPEIKIAKAIVTTKVGEKSELKCTVSGVRKPELKWYRGEDQKPILPSERFEIDKNGNEHILRIFKTEASDLGDYVCEAKNSEGKAEAVITLTGKPGRPELDSVVTETESKNPVLTFRVESYDPILEYELLYKKEQKDEWISVKPVVTPAADPDSPVHIVKHELENLEPGVYNAQLKAKNSIGWSEMSSKVTFPKEHEGDLTETGLLAIEGSSASELRISLALVVSLIVAHFYC